MTHPREIERAVHVTETAYGVKVASDANGLFTWKQPGNGRGVIVTVVAASGLVEVARAIELAWLRQFDGGAHDYKAEVSDWADELRAAQLVGGLRLAKAA